MKRLLFLILLLTSHLCSAQNYQCLQPGVKRYFVNKVGYLRGMRIDSVRTTTDTTIYYPFHTPRGMYSLTSGGPHILDTAGSSWLGKKVIELNDGTFLLDNFWHHTIAIETHANVGDSWTFYEDTTVRHYMAQVVSLDTMTILGTLDSVKKITITAFDDTGYVPADNVDSFQLILTKNFGFYQAFDLYTFPYRPPHYFGGSLYSGYDYFLDRTIQDGTGIISESFLFRLTAFVNPTFEQLYNWNVGDVFENSVCSPVAQGQCIYPYIYYLDTITAKTVFADSTRYSFSGWQATQVLPAPWLYVQDFNYPYSVTPQSGSFTVTNELLIDTTLMPEEFKQRSFIYYFPNDTSHCLNSCSYYIRPNYIEDGLLNPPIEGGWYVKYKIGVGLVHFFRGAPELVISSIVDTTLRYTYRSGTPCGTAVSPGPIVSVQNIELAHTLYQLFPNPVNDKLTIRANNTLSYTITLSDMVGQVISTSHTAKRQETINVADLPSGVYHVSITNENGNRHNEKVVITH